MRPDAVHAGMGGDQRLGTVMGADRLGKCQWMDVSQIQEKPFLIEDFNKRVAACSQSLAASQRDRH